MQDEQQTVIRLLETAKSDVSQTLSYASNGNIKYAIEQTKKARTQLEKLAENLEILDKAARLRNF